MRSSLVISTRLFILGITCFGVNSCSVNLTYAASLSFGTLLNGSCGLCFSFHDENIFYGRLDTASLEQLSLTTCSLLQWITESTGVACIEPAVISLGAEHSIWRFRWVSDHLWDDGISPLY